MSTTSTGKQLDAFARPGEQIFPLKRLSLARRKELQAARAGTPPAGSQAAKKANSMHDLLPLSGGIVPIRHMLIHGNPHIPHDKWSVTGSSKIASLRSRLPAGRITSRSKLAYFGLGLGAKLFGLGNKIERTVAPAVKAFKSAPAGASLSNRAGRVVGQTVPGARKPLSAVAEATTNFTRNPRVMNSVNAIYGQGRYKGLNAGQRLLKHVSRTSPASAKALDKFFVHPSYATGRFIGKGFSPGKALGGSALGFGADTLSGMMGQDTDFTTLGLLAGLSPLGMRLASRVGAAPRIARFARRTSARPIVGKTKDNLHRLGGLGLLGMGQQAMTADKIPGGINSTRPVDTYNRVRATQSELLAQRLGLSGSRQMDQILAEIKPVIQNAVSKQRF